MRLPWDNLVQSFRRLVSIGQQAVQFARESLRQRGSAGIKNGFVAIRRCHNRIVAIRNARQLLIRRWRRHRIGVVAAAHVTRLMLNEKKILSTKSHVVGCNALKQCLLFLPSQLLLSLFGMPWIAFSSLLLVDVWLQYLLSIGPRLWLWTKTNKEEEEEEAEEEANW